MTIKQLILNNIIIIVGILMCIGVILFRPTFVQGDSMQPTLKDNDFLICNTLDKTPEIGDIVVVDASSFIPGEEYIIKRVADVKDGMIYLKGDNLNNSYDSDEFGYISIDCLVGVII